MSILDQARRARRRAQVARALNGQSGPWTQYGVRVFDWKDWCNVRVMTRADLVTHLRFVELNAKQTGDASWTLFHDAREVVLANPDLVPVFVVGQGEGPDEYSLELATPAEISSARGAW